MTSKGRASGYLFLSVLCRASSSPLQTKRPMRSRLKSVRWGCGLVGMKAPLGPLIATEVVKEVAGTLHQTYVRTSFDGHEPRVFPERRAGCRRERFRWPPTASASRPALVTSYR